MKVHEIIQETTAGGIGAVAMPLFTGKKGKAHHKAAKKAVGLEGANKPADPVYSKMIRRKP
jgi:hypothetical protein|tara:strand:+ start:420 stop:602 length:183 start_codon:yes stop_codon:yes gene_type:complete